MNVDKCAFGRCALLRPRDIAKFSFRDSSAFVALAVVCLLIGAPAQAADKTPPAGAGKLPGSDLAAAMAQRGKPAEKDNFAVLMPLTGIWDYEESFWAGVKDKPEHGMGVTTNALVLDRRFLSSKASGSLTVGGEQLPVESQEMLGFDNARKAFTSTLADTLSAGIRIGSGTYDEKNHVLNETGHFTNPLTGAEEHFRSELKVVDPDHYQRVVFATDKSGKETKLLEIDYTKRK